MFKVAIDLTGVSKKYTFHHEKPTLTENIFGRKSEEIFWTLRNIHLIIKKGERVGIIGPNGSGKTTLLKIIAGITIPTTGKVLTDGKIVSLIELDAGFHPDLTGEENIFLNGLLVGMTKDEIKAKLKEIISFADIGNFIDAPMYTYSDGMRLRVGFSIVAHSDPDILLLDENMAVGDKEFLEKSLKKTYEFFKQGKTIISVSHYLPFIKSNCERVIWLDRGEIKKDGPTGKIVSLYEKTRT